MDRWARDFDNWGICDTVCFVLFDRTPHAWARVEAWADRPEEFVKRAAFALLWGLTRHDKEAPDARFLRGLELIEQGRDRRTSLRQEGGEHGAARDRQAQSRPADRGAAVALRLAERRRRPPRAGWARTRSASSSRRPQRPRKGPENERRHLEAVALSRSPAQADWTSRFDLDAAAVASLSTPAACCRALDAGWSSQVARWAHNPKVAGSNPAPATIELFLQGRVVTPGLLFFPVSPARALSAARAAEGGARAGVEALRGRGSTRRRWTLALVLDAGGQAPDCSMRSTNDWPWRSPHCFELRASRRGSARPRAGPLSPRRCARPPPRHLVLRIFEHERRRGSGACSAIARASSTASAAACRGRSVGASRARR